MAEILGLASSIITIVERCIEQLEILAPAIEEMDHEFEKTRNMIQNDSAAKRSLKYSQKAVVTLDTLVRDMETQISAAKTSRRLVAHLKLDIYSALSRAQPDIIVSEIRSWRDSEYQKQLSIGTEEDDQSIKSEEPEEAQAAESQDYFKSPVSPDLSLWSAKKPLPQRRPGSLGSFAFQSYEVVESPSIHYVPDKARFFQARVHMPWFIQRAWDLPMDAKIFAAVADGEVECIVESLKNKEASIYDMDPHGYSLLRIATCCQQIESIKALILMRMKISDIEPSDLFSCIYFCFWKDPQEESPMELGRHWTTEIGGISGEYLERHPFSDAFWKVPSVYTLLLETGSVRQMLPSLSWWDVNPAVALELIKSGLAETSDFPPYFCSSRLDGICECYTDNFIYQYFHALLNNDSSFNDWRCLARKTFLEVSPLDIVHPHDGAFSNLTGILEALWKRQFLLLPFARWIQNAITLWLEDLAAAGMNLEEYMSLELLYSREFHKNIVCKDTKVEIRPGAHLPESGPSLVILSVGPRADDWSFSWDPCVEELSGEFWTTLEDAQIKVPGAWVDDRIEDFECLMGDPSTCWFRREEKFYKNENTSSMVTKEILKEEHKHTMRLQGLEWPERKYREGLRVRGMTTCEEFSPYTSPIWL
ncbi:hypothetical protein FOC1_g10006051 [Fusarium oxysporum f. sp. cubense race 1]|uniref:NACHT-NTPase and P-loop NTPases N-terminal domain-containing protein n=1 Tax=Fusarium oxysporum f. sp. cubense (strain race 1) TaxID=1229664 RepID=N4TNS2_FUSC1|nr:hypothetical protein FOC1_g10006051 [Fusarium oxysporum f. sp. cubense race 1]